MGLVGSPQASAGEEVDDDDKADQGEAAPGPTFEQQPFDGQQEPPRRAARRDEQGPFRGAVAANSLLRQLKPGEQLLVERVGGQGARGFLCSIDVDGPWRYPDDLVSALQQRGHAAVGELELTLCDPATGKLVHRVITPPLVTTQPAPPAAFGAAPGVPPLPAGGGDMGQIVAACMTGMTQMTAAVAQALSGGGGGRGGGGGSEASEILKLELAKRDLEIQKLRDEMREAREAAASDDDDDDSDGQGFVEKTVGTIGTLQKHGLIPAELGAVASAAARETTSTEDWSGVAKVAIPGLMNLLQQAAHEIGEIKRFTLALDAKSRGIEIAMLSGGVPPPAQQSAAPAGNSSGGNGEGAAGGGS